MSENPNIILASTSPFRKALMDKMSIEYTTMKPDCDEEAFKEMFFKDKSNSLKDLCAFLADKKAESISKDHHDSIVIGSDQSLFLNNESFDKPKTVENAINQLTKCSGKVTELTSAVSIHYKNKKIVFENTTKLFFKDLSKEQITKYVKEDQPLQCAGSFMYEKKGLFLFKHVECSDPTNIEGLPLMQLSIQLAKLNVVLPFL